jgi:putative DNA primase/helicase
MQTLPTAITTTPTIYNYDAAQTLDQALRYLSQGYAPIPVEYQGKTPLLPKWPHAPLCEDDLPKHFGSVPRNIGIVLGARSNGLIDVDIDDDLALILAPVILPTTGMIFGRSSRRRSHWLYRSAVTKTKKFNDEKADVIVEIRGDGAQTVFPGSVHASGEQITFDADGEPSTADYEQLEFTCIQLCIATVLLRHWHDGSRHELALAAAGFLAKSRWKEDDVAKLIVAVAKAAADGETDDRRHCVVDTYQRLASGEPIQGYAKLCELLGEKIADKLASWCRSAVEADMSVTLPANVMATADISTDARAAETFSNSYNGKVRYCDGSNSWFRKDNQVYRPISAVQIQGVATKFARDLATQIAGRLPGGFSQSRCLKSCGRINSLVQLSRAKLRVDWAEIDKARNLIGLADGAIYDLSCMQVVDQSQALVTKTVGANFDQDAECPNWTKFLDRTFDGAREVIAFVRRAVGYTLSGEVGEQCLFLLIGTGANGKSTFINALNHLFGDYAATVPMHTLTIQRSGGEQTNDLALLPGKRFVAASEGEPGQRLAESRIKLMTGGDQISCRRLYQEYFAFEPQFKLWLATNSLPRISGVDEAIWRRIRVIRFPVTIPVEERDPDLSYALQSELPGILNWALEGYRNWKQQKLNPPEQVTKATGEYRLDNDTVGQFIEACCEKDPWAITTAKDLYDRYAGWSEQSGYEPSGR